MKKVVLLLTTALLFTLNSMSYSQGSTYTGPYTSSPAISWKEVSNKTISGLSFTNLNKDCIELWECSNITIKNCKFSKSAFKAITAENAQNLIIEDCVFDSIDGVYISGYDKNPFNGGTCSGVKITNNYFKNTRGVEGSLHNHAVQFMSVNGGDGNKVNYNSFELIKGQSNVDDIISMYRSHGMVSDSIEIIGNWLRGGDRSTGSGIMVGDIGGSYTVVRGNIICNIVATGIGNAGGNNIKIENNICYQDLALAEKYSSGIFIMNFTHGTTDCSSNIIRNNKVYYAQPGGHLLNYENGGNCGSIKGWDTNISDPTLNASILPQNIGIAKVKSAVTTVPEQTTKPLEGGLKIYPNPATDRLYIETNAQDNQGTIDVYNLNGQKLLGLQINSNTTEVDTTSLIKGVYIVKVVNMNEKPIIKKIIINKD